MTKKIEKTIYDSWKEFDEQMPVEAPNAPTLLIQLKEGQKRYKKKQRLELISFLLFAVFFITIFVLLMSKSPVIYFILQITSFVIVAVYVYKSKKSAKRSKTI